MTRLCALVVFLCACNHTPVTPVSPAAIMLGEWSYHAPSQRPDTPTLNAGVRVSVVIDSLDATRFWGRVTLWFAGDVGVAPSTFGRVSGSIADRSGVTIRIPREPADDHPLMIIGEVSGDVLTVLDCRAGADTGPFAPQSLFIRKEIA